MFFYKTKCDLSLKFMEVANKVGVLKSFHLICIDGKENYYIKENGLRGTPTIIMIAQNIKLEKIQCLDWLKNFIVSQNNNNQNQLLQDTPIPGNNASSGETFNQNQNQNHKYISRNNIVKRNSNNTESDEQTNNKQNGNNKNNNQQNAPYVTQINNQLIGFIGNEMTGYSDEYAYLACDNPMPKSFLPPTSDFQIYTAPENGKLDKQKQNIYLNNLETKREDTTNEIKSFFKSQHQNYEKNGTTHQWLDNS